MHSNVISSNDILEATIAAAFAVPMPKGCQWNLVCLSSSARSSTSTSSAGIGSPSFQSPGRTKRPAPNLGAKDCTPEISTSEIIVDLKWHFPMDVQWHFPTNCHSSVVCSKGMSLFQWIFTGIDKWISSGISQWSFTLVLSGV